MLITYELSVNDIFSRFHFCWYFGQIFKMISLQQYHITVLKPCVMEIRTFVTHRGSLSVIVFVFCIKDQMLTDHI